MAEPGARRLMTDRPGATRSGFVRPSAAVGPWPEKPAMTSSPWPEVPLSSEAPTVMTSGSSPGLVTVPAPGPLLDDETVTTMPLSHARSTAALSGLRT